jgi:hypothetical protein
MPSGRQIFASSPCAGDDCAANHFQPRLLLVAELARIADTEAGDPGICNGPADIVAKRFWVSAEATLIQNESAIRKVDSKICSLRFDCCAEAAPRRLLQQYRPQAASRAAKKPPQGRTYSPNG